MGAGYNVGTDVGPLISPEAKQRAERIISTAEEQVHCCYILLMQPDFWFSEGGVHACSHPALLRQGSSASWATSCPAVHDK